MPRNVVEDGGFERETGAGPGPIGKTVLDGLAAPVHVEIARAVPGERWAIEPDLDMSARRENVRGQDNARNVQGNARNMRRLAPWP